MNGKGASGRSRLWLSIKIVLTVALLTVLVDRVDLGALRATLAELHPVAITTMACLTVISVLVSAWRWRRVLARLGESVSLGALFKDTLVGTTYNLLLPTSVGGDIARSLRCVRRVSRPEHAWASVVFERILGLLSLVLVSALGLLYELTDATSTLLMAALGLASALTIALLVAPAPLRGLAQLVDRAWPRAGSFLRHLADTFAGPLAAPGARIETLAWSLLYQGVALSLLLPAGWTWQEPELVRAVFLGVPIALVASTLPITIGGLGLRESLFVVVLAPFHVEAHRAFALSIIWLAANVFAGVLGLFVLWIERK